MKKCFNASLSLLIPACLALMAGCRPFAPAVPTMTATAQITATATASPTSPATATTIPTPAAPVPTASPLPLPTLTPTPQLLAMAGTPLPEELTAISAVSAGEVSELAEWQTNTVTDLAWAPDNRTLAVAHMDGITFYDTRERKALRELYPKGGGVVAITFSPDGNWFVSGSRLGSEKESYAGNIQLWLGPFWKPLGILYEQQLAVSSIAFSPDSITFAASFTGPKFQDDNVSMWNVRTWEITGTLQTEQVLDVGFSPAGGVLATSSDRYAAKLWRLKDGRITARLFTSFTGAIESMVFAPNGRSLATGHYDGSIRIWDLETGNILQTMQSPGVVYSLALNKDGTLLASGDGYEDHAVRIWDVSSGNLLRVLEGHQKAVTSLLFSPMGDMLVSGSYDGSLRIWGLRP